MKVYELIGALEKMPPNAFVNFIYDGDPYGSIAFVYEARNGKVMLVDYDEVIYSAKNRPDTAPDHTEKYWYTPENPNRGEDGEIDYEKEY